MTTELRPSIDIRQKPVNNGPMAEGKQDNGSSSLKGKILRVAGALGLVASLGSTVSPRPLEPTGGANETTPKVTVPEHAPITIFYKDGSKVLIPDPEKTSQADPNSVTGLMYPSNPDSPTNQVVIKRGEQELSSLSPTEVTDIQFNGVDGTLLHARSTTGMFNPDNLTADLVVVSDPTNPNTQK